MTSVSVDLVSSYPYTKPIELSHDTFPSTCKVMEQSRHAFGALISPYLALSKDSTSKSTTTIPNGNTGTGSSLGKSSKTKVGFVKRGDMRKLARCKQCSAFINPYCELKRFKWTCRSSVE